MYMSIVHTLIHTCRALRARRRRTACFVRDLRFSMSSLPHTNGRPLVKLVGVRPYLRWCRFISWSIRTLAYLPLADVLVRRTVSCFPNRNRFSLLHVTLEHIPILAFLVDDVRPESFLHIVAGHVMESRRVGPAISRIVSNTLRKFMSRTESKDSLCGAIQLPSSPLTFP